MADRDTQPSPFNPGYGKKPAVYGGRHREIDELTRVFDTLDFGENNSVLVSGLRGAGKTAMLTVLEDAARARDWIVINEDASRGLMSRIMDSAIPSVITAQRPETKARLKSVNLWQFGAEWEYVDRIPAGKPRLRDELVGLASGLNGTGILITIDEVSSGRTRLRELSEFALQVQHALTDGAPIMVVFAGVKIDLDELLRQQHLTFLRRSKSYDFRRLSVRETRDVIHETVQFGGREITAEALDVIVRITQGYPYLIQLAGDYAWRHSQAAATISVDDARYALDHAIRAVQSRVISRVYDDLSDVDQEFVRAMAIDEGRSKIADIKARLGKSDQYVQVYKNRLIDSGYVQSAGRGYVEFSLPYLDQYIKTLIGPDLEDGERPDDGWNDFPAPRV